MEKEGKIYHSILLFLHNFCRYIQNLKTPALKGSEKPAESFLEEKKQTNKRIDNHGDTYSLLHNTRGPWATTLT